MDDYTRLVMSEKDSRIDEQAEENADLKFEITQLRRQLEAIRTAMHGYADSDLVSLATTLQATAAKSAEYYEAMKDAQAEAADLRRQLDRMQDTIAARTSDADALRGVLAACREVIGAVDNAALYDACCAASWRQ